MGYVIWRPPIHNLKLSQLWARTQIPARFNSCIDPALGSHPPYMPLCHLRLRPDTSVTIFLGCVNGYLYKLLHGFPLPPGLCIHTCLYEIPQAPACCRNPTKFTKGTGTSCRDCIAFIHGLVIVQLPFTIGYRPKKKLVGLPANSRCPVIIYYNFILHDCCLVPLKQAVQSVVYGSLTRRLW